MKIGYTIEDSEQSVFDLSKTTPRHLNNTVTGDAMSIVNKQINQDALSVWNSRKGSFDINEDEKGLIEIENSKSSSKDSLLDQMINITKKELKDENDEMRNYEIKMKPIIPIRKSYESRMKDQSHFVVDQL